MLEWARRIVGDARTMKEEMRAARLGLSGRIRIAAIPTALAMVQRLTTPFGKSTPASPSRSCRGHRSRFCRCSAISRSMPASPISTTSRSAASPAVPLYSERYQLITAAGNVLSDREKVTWAEISRPAALPADPRHAEPPHHRPALGRSRNAKVRPTLESNSMIVLFSHIRTGKWSSIMPLNLAETFGFSEPIRAIPIVEPDASHTVGLVAAPREPHTPLVAALLDEAVTLADGFTPTRPGR